MPSSGSPGHFRRAPWLRAAPGPAGRIDLRPTARFRTTMEWVLVFDGTFNASRKGERPRLDAPGPLFSSLGLGQRDVVIGSTRLKYLTASATTCGSVGLSTTS